MESSKESVILAEAYNRQKKEIEELEAQNKELREALSWNIIDLEDESTLPSDFDPVFCYTDDGAQVLQLMKYGTHVENWEWETCFSKHRNKAFPIDFVKKWVYTSDMEKSLKEDKQDG